MLLRIGLDSPIGTSLARSLAFPDGRVIFVVAGPAPLDLPVLARWLDRGCPDPAPLRTGFAAALIDPRTGEVTAAAGAREASWLWALERGSLLLSTGIRPLLDAQAEPALDDERMGSYLWGALAPEHTVYRGIERLPLGHVLTWAPGRAPWVRRWFRPEEAEPLGRDADSGALVRDTVRDAVAASLAGAGTVVAQLSGGLDSTTVVATAAALLAGSGARLATVSHVVEPWPEWMPPGSDDAPVITAFADAVGVSARLLPDGEESPLDSLRWLIDAAAYPFLNPGNAPWMRAVEQWVGDQGADLVLTGLHGSVGFSIDRAGQYRRALERGRLGLLARDVRARRALGDSASYIAHDALADVAPSVVRRVQRLRHGAGSAAPVPPLRDCWRPVDGPQRSRSWWRESIMLDHTWPTLLQPGPAGAWASDPLGDPELLRLLLRLPPDAWLGEGRSRDVARRAQAGLVPDSVRLRTARGMQGVGIGRAVARHQGDYHQALEEVASSALAARFLDLPALRASMTPAVPTDGRGAYAWQLVEGRALGFGLFLTWFEAYLQERRA